MLQKLFDRFIESIENRVIRKGPRLAHKKVVFHHVDAPAHSAVVLVEIDEVGILTCSRSFVPLDLVPTDDYLS